MAGYEVDPQQLDAAAGAVRDEAGTQLKYTLAALREVRITAGDFGRKHHESFEGYRAGVERLVACVDSYVRASGVYADNLTGAGKSYTAADDRTQADVRTAAS
ncbi:hypothetical protein HNR02_001083 [Amycolatopsis endophytica]|uniref:ESX-1 secretion-associated protein n=1 Tax=Amycolatopsis endophytica TaxID=860233 RepID=A0A853AYI5_9PSEU|nr:hypothetical protein [Amycolatopsis endophytica]NYI87760.1 hypothetical protein [Amycolatopsis endophytica]